MSYIELWNKIEPLIPEETELDQEVKTRIFIVLDIAEKDRLELKRKNDGNKRINKRINR